MCRVALLIIFVLSGCNSNPVDSAACFMSVNIEVTWCNVVDVMSTSSANRRLVSLEFGPSSSFIPYCFVAHFCLRGRMICSRRALNKSELKGSPCFVPRCMLNFLLSSSVRTWPVWLEYNFFNKSMYGVAMPCAAHALQMWTCSTV